MSFEDDLRRSLQARANDVSPDPATFARVQTRIRRGRTFRLAFAGFATALAVAGVAVAAPRLIDRRIEFEPAPVATAPAPDPTPAEGTSEAGRPAASADSRLVFTDGEGVYAMALDGEAAETLVPSPCPEGSECDMDPMRSVAAYSDGQETADINSVVAACNSLRYVRGSDAPVDIDTGGDPCAMSVAFSPGKSHLAWIGQPSPEGKPSLHTVDWTAAGPGEDDASFALPWADDVREVSIQDWVTSGDGSLRTELVLRGRRNGLIQLLRLPVEQQADGALGVTYNAPPVEARPGFVPLAFAASDTGVEHTLEARQEPDGYADVTIVRRIGTEIDAEIAAPADLLVNSPDLNESDLWMSDDGAAVVFGNAATGQAWYFTYDPDDVAGDSHNQPRPLAATIRHGELLTGRVVAFGGETGDADEPSLTPTDVYFGMAGHDACISDQPVSRDVRGPGVARAVLTELLEGPTSRESNKGVVSPFSAVTAGALNDIEIVDAQARVDFDDFSTAVGNDSCTKSAILDALDKTLLQFPTITSTRYSFDGDAEAWDTWLGESSETTTLPEAVAETAEQIHAAASTHDWDALRRLSAETSCTFSDQKEPCVPYWQDLEEQGEDPLGVLVDILERQPALNPDAPIWVWPAEYFDEGYLGPRAGIREDGVWMFYVPGGD